MTNLKSLISKIHSIGDDYCECQMYCWPGFDPMSSNPEKFFRKLGIEFDGDLFVRYQVKRTFCPLSIHQIEEEEREIGALLPSDYKSLLVEFGGVHLPGDADVAINTPLDALDSTRSVWCYEGKPLSVLAISRYNRSGDGNSIGFILKGSEFSPQIYEFDHELVYLGDDPHLWSNPIADSLSEFLLTYLNSR